MDWTPIGFSIIAALVGLATGWMGALKNAAPKIIEDRIAQANAEREAERKEREARIRSEAEKAAYDRNRQATREDKTLEMLHDMLDWLQEQREKDRLDEAAKRAQDEKLIDAVANTGFQLSGVKTQMTGLWQQANVTNDELKSIKMQTASIAQVLMDRADRNGRRNE